jgi:hypothetical protein
MRRKSPSPRVPPKAKGPAAKPSPNGTPESKGPGSKALPQRYSGSKACGAPNPECKTYRVEGRPQAIPTGPHPVLPPAQMPAQMTLNVDRCVLPGRGALRGELKRATVWKRGLINPNDSPRQPARDRQCGFAGVLLSRLSGRPVPPASFVRAAQGPSARPDPPQLFKESAPADESRRRIPGSPDRS